VERIKSDSFLCFSEEEIMSVHPAVTDYSSKSHNPVVALIIFSFVLATCACSMSKNSERSTAKPEAAPAVAANAATGVKRQSFAPVFLSNLELFLTAAKVSPEKIALTLSKIKPTRLGLAGPDAEFAPVLTSSVAALISTISISVGTARIVVYTVAADTATQMQITAAFENAKSTGEVTISVPGVCSAGCLSYLADRITEILEFPGEDAVVEAERIGGLIADFIATRQSEECESNQLKAAFTFIGGQTFGKAKILGMDPFLKKCLSSQPFCGSDYKPLFVGSVPEGGVDPAPFYEFSFECTGLQRGPKSINPLPYPEQSGTLCGDNDKKNAIKDDVIEQVKKEAEIRCQPYRVPLK